MSGFFRFLDGDWSRNSSSARIVFDVLVAHLPEGQGKDEVSELLDNNVLMLDMRDPSEDLLVDIIVKELPGYLVANFDTESRRALDPGFAELLRLAEAQKVHNQVSRA